MEQVDALRARLSAAGLDEVINYSFMNPKSLRNLGLAEDDPARAAIPILNPITEEMSLLRTTLMPGLLELLVRNLRRQITSVHVYEIGSVFLPESLPLRSQPEERPALGIALIGQAPSSGWGVAQRSVDFYDLKGFVEAALQELGVTTGLRRASHPALHPGRAAELVLDGRVVGVFGEVHPEVLERFEIGRRAYVAELDLGPLLGHSRVPVAQPLPRFPAIRQPKQQDICYATQNRQDAVKLLSRQADLVIVVGSPTSSNSNRLAELASRLGVPAYLIDDASALLMQWFEGVRTVGITAGASAPEVLVQGVVARIREMGVISLRNMDGVQEPMVFPLPKGLRLDDEASSGAANS